MEPKLSKTLDKCIAQISSYYSIESCLAEYPAMSQQLEPLLRTAVSIAATPRVFPSDEFRKMLKARLRVRLSENRVQAEAARRGRRVTGLTALSEAWQGFMHTIAVSKRVAIPVAVTLLLVLASTLYISWSPSLASPTTALTSKCTVSILSGSVECQKPDSTIWEKAQDGTTLEAGSSPRLEGITR